jgi:hypothetical protein
VRTYVLRSGFALASVSSLTLAIISV